MTEYEKALTALEDAEERLTKAEAEAAYDEAEAEVSAEAEALIGP